MLQDQQGAELIRAEAPEPPTSQAAWLVRALWSQCWLSHLYCVTAILASLAVRTVITHTGASDKGWFPRDWSQGGRRFLTLSSSCPSLERGPCPTCSSVVTANGQSSEHFLKAMGFRGSRGMNDPPTYPRMTGGPRLLH